LATSPAAAGFQLEVGGSLATITLDRPDRRNPQSPSLWAALAAVGESLPPDVRVVVLRALGPSFSAGLDRRMFTVEGIPGEPSLLALGGYAERELDATIASFQAGFSWLRDPRFVSVAAVQGHAVGAGFQLALACDLRLVCDDVQFSMKETSLGLVPDLGGTQPLVACVGYPRALELCVTGRPMGAAEAVACGLAVRAVPGPDLGAATDQLVAALLAAPRSAVSETKALLLGAAGRTRDEQLAAERAAQARRIAELVRGAGGVGEQ
jgi:enoyl-CoA hydratase/carnithine racemase